MNTAIELIPDERVQHLRAAIAAEPAAPVRLGLVGPGGYGKTAALTELATAYRDAGVRVGGVAEVLDDPSAALLVDDAHLLDPDVLRRIRAADPARVIVAARPWPVPDGLGELAAALDGTTALRPFNLARIGAHLSAVGLAPRPGLGEFVLAQTVGVPALVDRVARALDPSTEPSVPEAVVAEVGAELEALDPGVLAFLLAEDAGAGMHVDLLCDLLGRDRDGVGEVAKAARATGLVDQAGRLVPIVRLAVRTVVPVDRRTAVRQRLADAQLTRGPAWAERVALAGDLDTALRVADQVLTTPDAPGQVTAARVAAAALAHRGQLARSAELFRWSGTALAHAFAVVGLTGTGQPAGTPREESAAQAAPTLLSGAATLMARGVRASVAGSPTDALSDLVRASSLLEAADPAVLLPDSPAALAAVVAVHCGQFAVADSVLQRAVAAGMGGVPFAVRHRLLLAWVCLTRGDLTSARERLRDAGAVRAAGTPLPPRDWLFAVALEVGLARRTSDLAALRRVWAQAGDAVIRHPVDLYTLLPLGELAVAAARLGDAERLGAHQAAAWAVLDKLDNPPLWTASSHWSGVHAAIVAERRTEADEHATALAALAGRSRFHAVLATAARRWLEVLGGEVDPDAVEAAARDLHEVGLRWEAARLAGQAAIRTPDRKAMVRLMETARLLQGDGIPAGQPEASGGERLSERERQVARLVLDGLTYREVGDRLFISAKTVEHHVARIRQRLGSTSRRELLAQLRELLGEA